MNIKEFIPPILLRLYAGFRIYKGPYTSWNEAIKKIGKENFQPNMLKKVSNATKKVINGEIEYERDSVELHDIVYSWPQLSALLLAAILNKNSLRVLDFGGSLGTTYYQNRLFLEKIPSVQWGIVEQADFVEYGQKNLKQGKPKFYQTVTDCVSDIKPNVVIFGSVLQYLPDPYKTIHEVIIAANPNIIIIDRTPMTDKDEKVYIQYVPKNIYTASLPYWSLNEKKLIHTFKKLNYNRLEGYTCDFLSPREFIFKGLIFQHKS